MAKSTDAKSRQLVGLVFLVTVMTSIFTVQLFGEKQKHCEGGELLVRHAYFECDKKKGTWMAVEDQYFACPPGRAVRKFRVDEMPVEYPCGKNGVAAPRVAGGLYRELKGDPTCVAPTKEKTILVTECVSGSWAHLTYDVYKCADGSTRIALPATSVTTPSPLVACDKEPPMPDIR